MRNTIEMAREAGIDAEKDTLCRYEGWLQPLKAFEALVRADALANIDPSKMMSYQEGFEAGRFAEREACAKVCDDINAKYKWPDDVAERVASQWCADAIRARGETK
jgi:hypothetical protein